MSALDAEDIVLLLLAVDLLDQYTGEELAKAREARNNVKQASMLNMRARLIIVRGKLRVMRGAAP